MILGIYDFSIIAVAGAHVEFIGSNNLVANKQDKQGTGSCSSSVTSHVKSICQACAPKPFLV